MKEIVLRLTGVMPLLMHNDRLANPLDEFAKKIKVLTSKRSKTDDDHREIARLEWFGGIYADKDGPFLPTRHVRKCLINAGKVRKLGTAVARAVYPKAINVPVLYNGPRGLEELWGNEAFRDLRAVGIQTARTMRCRPQFPEWAVEVPLVIVTETLDFDAFEKIAELAGQIEGVGDGRSIGFGRFEAQIGGAK